MLKKIHPSLPTVLRLKGSFMFPIYTRGTKGQETGEAELKCKHSTSQAITWKAQKAAFLTFHTLPNPVPLTRNGCT